MPVEFIGKQIDVSLKEGAVRLPQRFKLAGKEHQVKEVISTWQDHGYSGLSTPRRGPGRAGWQEGSPRQFYRLRTTDGETFEIYVETPLGRKGRAQKARWYALRRLTGPAAPSPAPSQTEEQAPGG